MEYQPSSIESKWKDRWISDGTYEANPCDNESTFITVAYPYPSGGMHIGHARTYAVPDVYARYRRLCGESVLFPMAWHVTGTPIVGAVERLKKNEPEQLFVLQDIFGVSDEELDELKTPMGFARHFIDKHYRIGMKNLGLSIDWRREFTTNDERYSKFITWQYNTLHERGLLEKGLHPVKFCTNEKNPVTTHDILRGEDAEFQEYTLIKFKWGDFIIPMATLRPETIRGVTNAFVNPNSIYVEAIVDGERWIISKEAASKFSLQARNITVEQEIPTETLIGEFIQNPITEESVIILPATFVNPDSATGVVMSVPAHSPDDWVALSEAKQNIDQLSAYGIESASLDALVPISILTVEGYGEFPAKDIVESFGITTSSDPLLKQATHELYNKEFRSGILREFYGVYSGETVEKVRDQIKQEYLELNLFDTMYEFTEDVVCRCGGNVEVAIQETWFLRYNDNSWRQKALNIVDQLDGIPQNTKNEYYRTIDWLKEWPCIRNYGLGTRLPWDPDYVIEPLSDSTLYMAYYTISHHLNSIPIDDLTHEFFDALFFGPTTVDSPDPRALELRKEWEYWYPINYRCSANDLISNHLTFFLYHHAEFFDKAYWPNGIVVMGMGLLEGEKMSSSKGHVVLVEEAINKYGSDTVRFFLLSSAEPWQDYDWRSDQVDVIRTQVFRFWNRSFDIISLPEGDTNLSNPDKWLLSKLNQIIEKATSSLDRFETRTASQSIFYELEEYLKWHHRRSTPTKSNWALREVLRTRLIMLSPFMPFLSNELHELLTGKSVDNANWPSPSPEFNAPLIELEEDLIRALLSDIHEVKNVINKDPSLISIYTPAPWKYQVLESLINSNLDLGTAMGILMQNEDLRAFGNEIKRFSTKLLTYLRQQSPERLSLLKLVNEFDLYSSAKDFFEKELGVKIELYPEDENSVDPSGKASQSLPFRPGIYME